LHLQFKELPIYVGFKTLCTRYVHTGIWQAFLGSIKQQDLVVNSGIIFYLEIT